MTARHNRRDFLQKAAWSGVGFWVAASPANASSRSPNEKLNVAMIGMGAQGWANLQGVLDQNVVALCDVDQSSPHLARADKRCPNARVYFDYRRLLEERDIEAVVISTPDHLHAFATVMALELGKHVYCEKPLTHSVYEARVVAKAAAKQKLALQMGIQLHSSEKVRKPVELIRSGALGAIREVHAWTMKTMAPGDRPKEAPPVPGSLDWDRWLGPAPHRPYHPAYHPFKWRGWWDFGPGTLGDMGCHILDPVFWGLDLAYPLAVEAEGPSPHSESTPAWLIVRFDFPARDARPPVRVTWYDGGKRPPAEVVQDLELPDQGTLFLGEKGTLVVAHMGGHTFIPKARNGPLQESRPTIPASPGHHAEWIEACKGNGRPGCDAGYAVPLTTTVLLGNVAYRSRSKLEWDAAAGRCRNNPEADRFLRREYRTGWNL